MQRARSVSHAPGIVTESQLPLHCTLDDCLTRFIALEAMPAPAVKRPPASTAKKAVSAITPASMAAKTATTKCCALCGIATSKDDNAPWTCKRERHQVIPDNQRAQNGITRVDTISVCNLCRRAVHTFFTDHEIADHLFTLDSLKDALTDVG